MSPLYRACYLLLPLALVTLVGAFLHAATTALTTGVGQ